MRRALTVVLVTSLVAGACSSESVARPPPPPVNWRSLDARPAASDAGTITATERERATADAYPKALASAALAELGRYLDEDAHFTFAGYRDVHGRENVVQVHNALFGAFDPRTFVASRVLLTDSAQIVEWTMTGAHNATHKQVTFKGVALLWTKDDGSIADVHLYFDDALAKAQLGIGPKALVGLPAPPMPSGERQEVEQTRSPDESANVAVIRAALEALENADESAYVATMTDDVEVTTLESAKPSRGKPAARGYLKAMHKAIGQLDTSIDNVWGIGPYVVVEYHIVGEQRGPLAWIPAQKDNLLKMFLVDVSEMRGGKIAHVWRYDNPAQILSEPPRDP
jgi:ketosteroid isomerase-like protein